MSVVDAEPLSSPGLPASSPTESVYTSAESVVISPASNCKPTDNLARFETPASAEEELHEGDSVHSLDGGPPDRDETWDQLDRIEVNRAGDGTLRHGDERSCTGSSVSALPNTPSLKSQKPFHHRWMNTLRRRTLHRQALGAGENELFHGQYMPHGGRTYHHRKSSSGSSAAFVTAVRSASVSLASTSFWTRSRRNLRSSRGNSNAGRSSRASVSGARMSTDSTSGERVVADPAVIGRSLQRRRILEELIETEEGYIGDVRFLMNVYITILASLPTLSPGLRSSINQNLTEIVELHETLLGDLHRVVPHSEYTQLELPSIPDKPNLGHKRWRSLDIVPEDKVGLTWLQAIPGMTAEPQVAAEVAKVFSKRMNRFFIYEEYGAKYELMIKDVASAHRTLPKWESYQKGLEALAVALGTGKNQGDHQKRSLTIGDLLVKPIQRVCRYPLLFAELLRYTPVCDCPHSHMQIEDTLIRLREATAEINRATDDARIKATLEKTWILQDRLVFANHSLDAASKNTIRSFGHIRLCGALHICWQTKESITGQYMVALLYRDWLCLALASRVDQIYTIQACINITTAKIENVDNGRGVQCHSAPHSWKVVFLSDHHLYEIIMTACTAREEQEWCTRLRRATFAESPIHEPSQPVIFDTLNIDIKPLGVVFGKPGTIARRVSVHRATTVSPKMPLCQVILKNTSVTSSNPTSTSSGTNGSSSSINRSMSLLTTNTRIPVLAPSRGDRARLEALLSDVWTRDILPFPGITTRSKSEYLVKSSAGAMMRKLSVASIAGSFKKGSRENTRESVDTAVAVNHNPRRSSMKQSASSMDWDEDYFGRASFLASIPDDEKSYLFSQSQDTTIPGVPDSEWGADVLRTISLMVDDARKQSARRDGFDCRTPSATSRPSTPALSNKRVKRRASTLTTQSSTCNEKDISPRRLKGKWPRVRIGSVRHTEVVRGLRNLFH